MIATPKDCNAHLASTWTAGIAAMFLAIGMVGATAPLVPEITIEQMPMDIGEEVAIEEFEAPADSGPVELKQDELEEEIIEDVEIPPVPEIAEPLTPPEMAEITPLETPPPPIEKPKPKPKPIEDKPKPKPAVSRPAPARPSTSPGTGSGGGGGSGPPTLFSGGGRGRYPSPGYPAEARSARLQGSVRSMVTVETSGMPSSVSVISSSGHSVLDSAAQSHVRRRWRWPSGDVRRYIVPIRFVLR